MSFWFSLATMATGVTLATWGQQPELGAAVAVAAAGKMAFDGTKKRAAARKKAP